MIELIHRLKKNEITKDVFIVEFTTKYNALDDYNRIKAIVDLIDIYMDDDSTILKDLIHLPDFNSHIRTIQTIALNYDKKDIFSLGLFAIQIGAAELRYKRRSQRAIIDDVITIYYCPAQLEHNRS